MYLLYNMILSDFGKDFMNNLLGILCIIPKFLYFLFTSILSIVDLLQVFFRSIVGLDTVIINGASKRGDLAYNIIVEALFGTQFPALKTAFWSMIILGLILLVIATLVANIRIEYKPDKEKGNSRNGIVKNFFKALAFMGIVPIATIFGLYLGNTILFAIDSATNASVTYNQEKTSKLKAYTMDDGTETFSSFNVFGIQIPTKTTPFSSLVFISSAYGCNRVRDNNDFYISMSTGTTSGDYTNVSDLGVFKMGSKTDSADMVDFVFSIGAQLKTPASLNTNAGIVGIGVGADPWVGGISGEITTFNKNNVDLVWYYYDMIKFNWIVAFIALLMICKIMLNICFDMIGRLVEVVVLFLAAPVAASTLPLGGDMVGSVTKRMLSKAVMAYSAVFCLNIIYSIIPIIQSFKFIVIDNVAIDVINYLINTLLLIGALKTMESLIGFFAKLIGADEGGKLKESTLGALKEGMGAATTFAKVAAAPLTIPARIPGAVRRHRQDVLQDRLNYFDSDRQHDLDARNQQFDADMRDSGLNLNMDTERANYLNSDEYRTSRAGQYRNWARTAGGMEQIRRYRREHGIADGDNSHDDEIRNHFMSSDNFQNYLNDHHDAVSDAEVSRSAFMNRFSGLDAAEQARYADASDYANQMNAARDAMVAQYNSDINQINNNYSQTQRENLQTQIQHLQEGAFRGYVRRHPNARRVVRAARVGADVATPVYHGARNYARTVASTGILDPVTSIMSAFGNGNNNNGNNGNH